MIRRLAITLALPLAALSAACAPGAGGGYYAPSAHGDYDFSSPLDARIHSDFGRLGIRLSRPAHVAVFEVVPGRGVGLVYPSFSGEQHFLRSGYSRLILNPARRYEWYYADYNGNVPDLAPRYYLLVASDEPLRIDGFQRSSGGLRSMLGLSRFASIDAGSVMDDVVSYVVPPQAGESWTTDVLVVYPERSRGYDYSDDDQLIRVRCPDGSVAVVPAELFRYACRDGRSVTPPPLRPDTTGGDSADVAEPGKRRPDPRNAFGDPSAPSDRAVLRPKEREWVELPPVVGEGSGEAREPRERRPGGDRRIVPHIVEKPADENGGRTRPETDAARRAEPETGRQPAAGAERQREEPRRIEPRARPSTSEPRQGSSGNSGGTASGQRSSESGNAGRSPAPSSRSGGESSGGERRSRPTPRNGSGSSEP